MPECGWHSYIMITGPSLYVMTFSESVSNMTSLGMRATATVDLLGPKAFFCSSLWPSHIQVYSSDIEEKPLKFGTQNIGIPRRDILAQTSEEIFSASVQQKTKQKKNEFLHSYTTELDGGVLFHQAFVFWRWDSLLSEYTDQ